MSPSTEAIGRVVRGEAAWPRILLAALSIVTAVTLVVLAATSATAFGVYNPSWDGSADFRRTIADDPGTDLELVRTTDAYADRASADAVAFVTAPADAYAGADARRIRRFVEDGGRLVVLENFGSAGNGLLERVGAETRVDGRLLRDERRYDEGPAMPVATTVNETSMPGTADRVTLNYATAVDPGPNATVLVRTSPFARLGDEDVDLANASLDSSPVATVEPVGDGEVVVVGDPSLTINAMLDEPENEAFLAGLYADADVVLVDVSHGDALPPLRAAALTLRASPALGLAVGLGAIAAIAVIRPRRLSRLRPDRLAASNRADSVTDPSPRAETGVADPDAHAARAEALRQAHPDWDEERIQRVITALNRSRGKGNSHE